MGNLAILGKINNVLDSKTGSSTPTITNNTNTIPTVTPETQYNTGNGIGYLGEKVGLGFLSGIEGIWDYTSGGIAKLFGNDSWAEQQFANDWVNYNHADEWFNPSDGWRVAGDVSGGIGTSLPAILGVAAGAGIIAASGGTLSPVAAKLILASASAAIAGFSSAGNSTKEAYRESGQLTGKEFGYGALSGVTEAGLELATAGIGKGTGRIVSSLGKKASQETAEFVAKKGVKTIFKELGEDFVSESFEEGMAEFLSPQFKKITYDPNAKNATLEEITYAAMVGGLSGIVMSGSSMATGATVNTVENYASGVKSYNNGNYIGDIQNAKVLAEYAQKSGTDIEVIKAAQDTYNKLTDSLKQTNGIGNNTELIEKLKAGQVRFNEKQKMYLGALKKINTAAVIDPFIQRSAQGLVMNADVAAQRYSRLGMTDANGKPLNVTAKDILSGVDASLVEKMRNGTISNEESNSLARQLRKALTTNSVLATLASMEATGNILSDTRKIADSLIQGENIANTADINRLMEKGNAEEIKAVSAALGVDDITKISSDEIKQRSVMLGNSENASKYSEQIKRINYALKQDESTAKPLPHMLRKNMQDGVYRYKSADGSVDMAILKDGDKFYIVNYETQDISVELTSKDVNKILNRFWTEGKTTKTEQNKKTPAEQTADIDAWARENIDGYNSISEPNKAAVRMTVRQARALGVSDAQIKVLATVAARSGLNIVFDSRLTADGEIEGNTILINPNNSETRTYEVILGHEMFHHIFANGTKRVKKLYNQARELITKEKAEEVRAQYTSFYKKQNAPTATARIIAEEEVAARGAEEVFRSADAWKYILSEEPTLADKVLSFFRKSARDYSSIQSLSSQARKFVRLYKKMFDSITAESKGNNALSIALEGAEGVDIEKRYSFSSISYSFFGDTEVTTKDFENGSYKNTEGYNAYVNQCLNNMKQTRASYDEASSRKEVESSIKGIVDVAVAMKKVGYDILDNKAKRETTDSKNRLLFSSLEPNSDYITSSDISTICDKRINFAEIYDDIVTREKELNVPKGKRFFDNVDNYFILHKIMADKGLTQPCRECYVESMRKNLAPMANAFLELVQETDPNNKSNPQLYNKSGKNKGELKVNNAKIREKLLEAIEREEYDITVDKLDVETLTTDKGLATLRLQAPLIYEVFNSFYGQSKPKMPKSATPFRFGELTALLTNDKGKINESLVERIKSTGGFRLQSYSDFQIQNFADVLQVIFEAGTLGLNGHAYTKVPAFLDATKGTNLKRNISIFMYKDGNQWKLDRNDSFPYELDKIYDIVKADKSGDTSIIAVVQNEDMAAYVMANDNIGYFIPFHKSGLKMGIVRETIVKEGGREIMGYSGIKDHTRQQTEVWAFNENGHKAYTKVDKGINIYKFWDFDNTENLSHNELIEKNLKAYIDECEKARYVPKFREYLINNDAVLNDVLKYAKELGTVSSNATIDDISFIYKGYRIPYGYYKCLGDFGMFKPNGEASPIETLSLKDYNFKEAIDFFSDSETLRRNEILQQISNGEERARYRESNMTTAEIAQEVQNKRKAVTESVISGEYKDISNKRFALTNYTEEQYNSFGWARTADALSASELDDLYSKIQARATLRTFKQSSKGEAIIEVNKKPRSTLDVNNTFVFVKGTKNNFDITRVIKFDAETETEMEIIKETLYEGRTFSDTHLAYLEQKGFATQYTRESAKSFSEYQRLRESGETSRGAYQNNRGREKYRSGYSLEIGENGEIIENRRYALPEAPIKDIALGSIAKAPEMSFKDKAQATVKETTLNFIPSVISTQIQFTNAQAGIEYAGKQLGITDIEATVQRCRSSRSMAQEMIGGSQWLIAPDAKKNTAVKLGDGLEPIFAEIRDRRNGETKEDAKNRSDAFDYYLYHKHNVDRMSLEKRSLEKNESKKEDLKVAIKNKRKLEQQIKENQIFLDEIKGKYNDEFKEQRAQLNAKKRAYNTALKELNGTISDLKKEIENFVVENNKPVLGKLLSEDSEEIVAVTADESKEMIKLYEERYPEFKKVSEKLYRFLDNLLRMQVNFGMITEGDYEYLRNKYPHYVPTYRTEKKMRTAPIKGKGNIEITKTVNTAKGSVSELEDLVLSIGRLVQRAINAGNLNVLGNKLYNASLQTQNTTYLKEISRTKATENIVENEEEFERPKDRQINIYRDGERITLAVTHEVFQGFDDFNSSDDSMIFPLKALSKITSGFKTLVTSANPIFLVRNMVRDLQDAGINTKYARAFVKNYAKAIYHLSNNTELAQLYRAYGGFNTSIFDYAEGFTGKQSKMGFANSAQKYKWLVNKIENANMFIEQLPRFAEFISSIEAGTTIEQAILNAADVTTNFGRSGKLTRKLNRTIIPFLNPAVQGLSKIVRNVNDARKSVKAFFALLLKCVVLGILPMAFNNLLYSDDEEYATIKATDKENNYLLRFGDTWIKIPKGRFVSVLAGLANRTSEEIAGGDADWKEYFENVVSQVTPVENFTRPIWQPIFDARDNRTWYGSEIEGRQFENVRPGQRYDESTSEIAKWIGEKLNYSPKKIHYILDQYSGVIGDFVLPATTQKAEKSFLASSFVFDPVTSNKLSNDFYKIYEEAKYAKSEGNITATYQFKHLNEVKSAISDMYDEISEIQNSDLSSADKLQQVRVLRILINNAYKTATDDYAAYTAAIESTAGLFDETSATGVKMRHTEITHRIYGAEKAFETYSLDVYEKMNRLNFAGIDYEVLYQYYFGTKDIKNDYDRRGNVIEGSKRKKVVATINQLKLSKAQKLLLLCSKGYSIKGGDVRGLTAEQSKKILLKYILSQNGLSKEQRIELARDCGFEVKNGKIRLKSA